MGKMDEKQGTSSAPLDKIVSCKCGGKWPHASEQSASIGLYGACIVCRKNTMTREELERICLEATERGAYSNV